MIFNSNRNACSFSCVSARLDHLEQLNQQNQVVSENTVKIQSLVSSLDQFKSHTERRLSVFEDQIKTLHLVASVETDPIISPILVEPLGLEQEEVVEGLPGKVKGLEKQIQTER